MSIGIVFWVLMIIVLVFGGVTYFRGEGRPSWVSVAPGLLVWVCIALLGWAKWPIHR